MAKERPSGGAGLVPRLALFTASGILAVVGLCLLVLGAEKPAFGRVLAGDEAGSASSQSPAAPASAAVGFGTVALLVGALGSLGAYKSSRPALLAYHALSTVLLVGLIYSATLAGVYRSAAARILAHGSSSDSIENAEHALHGLFAAFVVCGIFLVVSLWSSAHVMGWAYTLSRLGSASHVAVILFGLVLISMCAFISSINLSASNAVTLNGRLTPNANNVSDAKYALQSASSMLHSEPRRIFNGTSTDGDEFDPSAVWMHQPKSGDVNTIKKGEDGKYFFDFTVSFAGLAFEANSENKEQHRQSFKDSVEKSVNTHLKEKNDSKNVSCKMRNITPGATWAFPGARTAIFLSFAGTFTIVAGFIGLYGIMKDSSKAVLCHLALFLPIFIILCTGASFAASAGKHARKLASRRWDSFAGHEIPHENLQYLLSANMRTAAALGSLVAVLLFASVVHSSIALLLMTTGQMRGYSPVNTSDAGDEEVAHLNESNGTLGSHLESVEAKRREAGIELQGLRRDKHED
jgi:hypothetical protein